MTWSGSVAGTVAWDHDPDGRLREHLVNGQDLVAGQDDYRYDADGLLLAAGTLDIGREATTGLLSTTSYAAGTGGVVTTSATYNPFAELATFSASDGATTLYALDVSARDKLGRITQKVETIDTGSGPVTTTTDYAYDLAGRLDTVHVGGALVWDYAYDGNGNRTETTPLSGTIASYDDQDRMLTYEGFAYGYTDNGELLTKTETATSAVTSYDYDALGALRSVTLPDGTVVAYGIDAANRRVAKWVTPPGGSAQHVYGLLYGDALNPVARTDAAGAVVQRYVYGTRSNVPDTIVEPGGATYRVVTDHLGSVRLVVDASSGVIRERIDYDAFGDVTLREEYDAAGTLLPASTPPLQPFGFAGGLWDPDTELVRFGARDYDPATGRWTAKDPVLFDEATNAYTYALLDPINAVDVNGLASITVQGFAGLGGRVTLGFDRNGDFFAELGAGFGIGIDISFDPTGQPASAECDVGDDPTAGVALIANAGFGAGPLGADVSTSASGLLNTPACGCTSEPQIKPSLSPNSFKDTSGKLKLGGVASVTGNFVFLRGNRLRR